MVSVCLGVSVCVGLLIISCLGSVHGKQDKDGSFSEFKPRDVKSGDYPDYEKYVDMPEESLEQTLWRKVLRDPKTKRPTKPMTKRRAKMMRRRKMYEAILDIDDRVMQVLKEENLQLDKRNFTKIYLQQRAEREAEEARWLKISSPPPPEVYSPPPPSSESEFSI